MSQPPPTPEQRYDILVGALLGAPGVTVGVPGKKGFGSGALCVGGRIFAMLTRGRLVVRLPQQRVAALVASGDGERFDPGHGRLMKEWLSLAPASAEQWLPLAGEALAFVAAKQ